MLNREMVGRQLVHTLKRVPLVDRMVGTPTYRRWRHQLTLALSRRQSRSFTQFMRVPTQYRALTGPVLDWLLPGIEEELRIIVIGCSNGAEAYSIAAAILAARPGLDFRIDAFDIDEVQLARARRGLYTLREVHDNPLLPRGFEERVFKPHDAQLQVRPEIAQRVSFESADALSLGLADRIGQGDIVFAQNFLYHLSPRAATRAFHNLVALMEPRAALFVDGMDLGLRQRLTRSYQLRPLLYQLERIHEEARQGRGSFYPYVYFGLEPFQTIKEGWENRYATIFLRE